MRYSVYLMAIVSLGFGIVQIACAVSDPQSNETSIQLMGVVFFAPFTMIAAITTLVLESFATKTRKPSPVIVSVSSLLLVSQLARFALG